MTGQIADVYEYNGNRYNIVAIKGTMNFDIHELGFDPVPIHTALVDGDGGAQAAPLRSAVPIAAAVTRADLREDLLAGIGDKRGEQHRADADTLKEVIHDGGKAGLVRLVLGERPGRGLVRRRAKGRARLTH